MVRSYHSQRSLRSAEASGHSASKLPGNEPIREDSKEALASSSAAAGARSAPEAAPSVTDDQNEYLIRRLTLGEFDFHDISAVLAKYGDGPAPPATTTAHLTDDNGAEAREMTKSAISAISHHDVFPPLPPKRSTL